MINCNETINYFAEKARMTGATADNDGCMIKCRECPLSHCNNGENEDCSTLEMLYTEKAIEIVQKWSDEHPRKTIRKNNKKEKNRTNGKEKQTKTEIEETKMTKTNLSASKLCEKGFIKKPCIISSSRVCKDDEYYIGQIDEHNVNKDLLVLSLPKGFRFNKYIVVNYRHEVFLYESGFMSGGIKIYTDFNDTEFLFRETEQWINEFRKILCEIVS